MNSVEPTAGPERDRRHQRCWSSRVGGVEHELEEGIVARGVLQASAIVQDDRGNAGNAELTDEVHTGRAVDDVELQPIRGQRHADGRDHDRGAARSGGSGEHLGVEGSGQRGELLGPPVGQAVFARGGPPDRVDEGAE